MEKGNIWEVSEEHGESSVKKLRGKKKDQMTHEVNHRSYD